MVLDKKGRLTVFLQQDANSLKCSMFSYYRMSHIDQDNLHTEKEQWKQWADVYFEKVINHDIDESDSDESDSDEYEDRKHLVGNTKQQKQTDGKLVFVYQSPQMKRHYRLYAPSLLLLDATYKTAKYAVPLFFAAVKTNVNLQVVCVIVLLEETEPMITKALLILMSRSPDVNPKYAMLDFGEKEISTLENVFSGILVFSATFTKNSNGQDGRQKQIMVLVYNLMK